MNGKRVTPPLPPPIPPAGNVTPPGHELCRHGVPIKFVNCKACELEQKEMAEAEAAKATAVPVASVGPGEGGES
jgi:hypothetical protein